MLGGAPTPLPLDAGCVINLFGSKREAEILAAIRQPVAVAAHVAQVEALYVYRAIWVRARPPISPRTAPNCTISPSDRRSIKSEPAMERRSNGWRAMCSKWHITCGSTAFHAT